MTRAATWDVTAWFGKTGAAVESATRVAISDFGMTLPKVGPVLGVDDEAGLELDLRLERKAAASEV